MVVPPPLLLAPLEFDEPPPAFDEASPPAFPPALDEALPPEPPPFDEALPLAAPFDDAAPFDAALPLPFDELPLPPAKAGVGATATSSVLSAQASAREVAGETGRDVAMTWRKMKLPFSGPV
jgi:hypothetical protein